MGLGTEIGEMSLVRMSAHQLLSYRKFKISYTESIV